MIDPAAVSPLGATRDPASDPTRRSVSPAIALLCRTAGSGGRGTGDALRAPCCPSV